MMEIRITLNNGQDVWLAMPSSPAEMAEAYAAYGNAINEGKQIRDAKSPVGNLSGHLRGLTVTSRVLEELVFLNQRIEGMTEQEREIFGAMLEIEKPYSVMEMVNLSCNMDKFVHYPEITDEALLGEYVLKKNSRHRKSWWLFWTMSRSAGTMPGAMPESFQRTDIPSGQGRHWSRYTMASICLIPVMRRTACLF